MPPLDPARHESALHTGLLARAAAAVHDEPAAREAIADELFAILKNTRVAALWRAAAASLRALDLPLEPRSREALADGTPAWRLQPLVADPAIALLLLNLLSDPVARRRIAALRALAPRMREPQIRDAALARLHDDHEHVRSTAVEVLRPAADQPPVRDALLDLFASAARLPGRVDRALRRSLAAAATDPRVQDAMIRALRGPRAHTAAVALAAATPSDALADRLLAVLAVSPHFGELTPAFTPVAHLERVTDAFLARADGDSQFGLQAALRVIGRGVTTAARDRLIAALDHDTNWIRWTALESLARHLGDPTARAAVLRRLDDVDDSVRMIALEVLAALADDPQVRASARPRLADPSPAVRIAAAGLLARTSPDLDAWAALAPHVTGERSSREYTKQWQAIDALSRLGALVERADVRDALAPMLVAHRAEQRAAAARCLAAAPPSEPIADLLAARIATDEPRVADAAFATLRRWTGVAG